jgi:hypothetical protein
MHGNFYAAPLVSLVESLHRSAAARLDSVLFGWSRLRMKRPASLQALEILVPIIGFELMTYRLQGGCSTN